MSNIKKDLYIYVRKDTHEIYPIIATDEDEAHLTLTKFRHQPNAWVLSKVVKNPSRKEIFEIFMPFLPKNNKI